MPKMTLERAEKAIVELLKEGEQRFSGGKWQDLDTKGKNEVVKAMVFLGVDYQENTPVEKKDLNALLLKRSKDNPAFTAKVLEALRVKKEESLKPDMTLTEAKSAIETIKSSREERFSTTAWPKADQERIVQAINSLGVQYKGKPITVEVLGDLMKLKNKKLDPELINFSKDVLLAMQNKEMEENAKKKSTASSIISAVEPKDHIYQNVGDARIGLEENVEPNWENGQSFFIGEGTSFESYRWDDSIKWDDLMRESDHPEEPYTEEQKADIKAYIEHLLDELNKFGITEESENGNTTGLKIRALKKFLRPEEQERFKDIGIREKALEGKVRFVDPWQYMVEKLNEVIEIKASDSLEEELPPLPVKNVDELAKMKAQEEALEANSKINAQKETVEAKSETMVRRKERTEIWTKWDWIKAISWIFPIPLIPRGLIAIYESRQKKETVNLSFEEDRSPEEIYEAVIASQQSEEGKSFESTSTIGISFIELPYNGPGIDDALLDFVVEAVENKRIVFFDHDHTISVNHFYGEVARLDRFGNSNLIKQAVNLDPEVAKALTRYEKDPYTGENEPMDFSYSTYQLCYNNPEEYKVKEYQDLIDAHVKYIETKGTTVNNTYEKVLEAILVSKDFEDCDFLSDDDKFAMMCRVGYAEKVNSPVILKDVKPNTYINHFYGNKERQLKWKAVFEACMNHNVPLPIMSHGTTPNLIKLAFRQMYLNNGGDLNTWNNKIKTLIICDKNNVVMDMDNGKKPHIEYALSYMKEKGFDLSNGILAIDDSGSAVSKSINAFHNTPGIQVRNLTENVARDAMNGMPRKGGNMRLDESNDYMAKVKQDVLDPYRKTFFGKSASAALRDIASNSSTNLARPEEFVQIKPNGSSSK